MNMVTGVIDRLRPGIKQTTDIDKTSAHWNEL